MEPIINEIDIPEEHEVEEKGTLEVVLYSILEKAIEGIPALNIESTQERATRYLSLNDNDPFFAFRNSKEKNFSLSAKIYRAVFESIPILGIPIALVYPIWKIMRALCLLACLYGNNIENEEVQEKILLCFSMSTSSSTLQTTKPIAVHALSTATKNAVLPEVTTVLAQRAATNYLTTGIKMVSTQGTEVAVETAGSFLAGKYGGLVAKFLASKTGLIEALNQVTVTIGNRIINQGVPAFLTTNLATQPIVSPLIQGTVSRTASIATYSIAGAVVIPINLLLGWILDNSEEIFKNARLTFIPECSSDEDLINGFEIVEESTGEDERFQLLDSISFLSTLPESECGSGYIYSWVDTPESKTDSSYFFGQQWGYMYKSFRIVCKHFHPGTIVPLISCANLEDSKYILQYLRKLESKMNYVEFLSELNKNETYLRDLLCDQEDNK